MRRIASHLTYANVMVTILAFLVLGGGTAIAAYVVTSNSQIGPGTVSGHTPPSGKHPNILAGSVNGGDVANNTLRGKDIIESTLTGNAQKLIYHGSFTERQKIATVGPYAIKVSCSQSPHVTGFSVYVNGPAGTANYMFITRQNDSGPSGEIGSSFYSHTVPIPAHQDAFLMSIQASAGFDGPTSNERFAGTAMLRFGSSLVQFDLNGVAHGAAGTCALNGTGTLAT
jgi:hypothetical protein